MEIAESLVAHEKLDILFFIIPVLGVCQCKDLDKLDFGGTLQSKSRHYIPFDPNITDTIQYCCDIKKIETYSSVIIAKARAFIIARTNEDFYNKLEINQVDVNYDDSIKIAYNNQSLYNLSNFHGSYWITYTYSNGTIQYGFGLEFDKNGEMISENKFPDFATNKGTMELTDICSALEVVKQGKRFSGKEVEFVELAYLDEINSFCWLVQEKMKPTKCGSTHYSIDHFYVNANTNKLETVKRTNGIVTVCCATLRSSRRAKH